MNNQTIIVSELNCYPVKSCRGIALATAEIGGLGIRYDRQWMVINENGVFVAQRGDSKSGATGIRTMCLIEPVISQNHLIITAPGMPPLMLPLLGCNNGGIPVKIWDTICMGIDQGDEAAGWFTEYLAREVAGKYRLVRMPDEGNRTIAHSHEKLAFADAFPFLLTSEATLQYLNQHMDETLPMNRFRPNIVMKGCDAFAEEKIDQFRINGIKFRGIKRDGRCAITTINQMTSVADKEPLKTLGKLKEDGKYMFREGNQVYFGMYLTHTGTGKISVGNEIVIERSKIL